MKSKIHTVQFSRRGYSPEKVILANGWKESVWVCLGGTVSLFGRRLRRRRFSISISSQKFPGSVRAVFRGGGVFINRGWKRISCSALKKLANIYPGKFSENGCRLDKVVRYVRLTIHRN